jgi:hypothetical protein
MSDLNRAAIAAAADAAGLPVAAVMAVAMVESLGTALWRLGDLGDWPPLRPEGHVFWDTLPLDKRQEAAEAGLAWPDFDPGRAPRTRRGAVQTYLRMAEIDAEAAAAATSWGLFQVMGWHAPTSGQARGRRVIPLGYANARALATAARSGVAGQIEAGLRYIAATGLASDLARLPDRRAAERFARGFNGKGWRRNDYAGKLIEAWHAASLPDLAPDEAPLPPPSPRGTAALQRRLAGLGYDPGAIDGMHGSRTASAITAFQRDHGAVSDGIPGPMTHDLLDAAEARRRAEAAPARRRKAAVLGAAATALIDDAADPAAMLGQATQAVEGVTEAARQSGILEALGPLGTAAALAVVAWLAWPHVERLLGGEGRR